MRTLSHRTENGNTAARIGIGAYPHHLWDHDKLTVLDGGHFSRQNRHAGLAHACNDSGCDRVGDGLINVKRDVLARAALNLTARKDHNELACRQFLRMRRADRHDTQEPEKHCNPLHAANGTSPCLSLSVLNLTEAV